MFIAGLYRKWCSISYVRLHAYYAHYRRTQHYSLTLHDSSLIYVIEIDKKVSSRRGSLAVLLSLINPLFATNTVTGGIRRLIKQLLFPPLLPKSYVRLYTMKNHLDGCQTEPHRTIRG